MLVKCETKSNRVKSLAFHPRLNWLLSGLHNGLIQLWDYRIGTLIDRFDEHQGPVRGLDFHASQPLFVSAGDDYRIKVWDYHVLRRCVFTFYGHLDYIRTVEFHKQLPLLLSASDDQTIRVWNWQSRNCVAVVVGHNYYVMSAKWHPDPAVDYIVSASLDQTVRLWNYAEARRVARNRPDIVCKYLMIGHERGVNWAAHHPKLPLIASAADDRTVRLWRYNEAKWWEVDCLKGHFHNVSAVIFLPTRDLLLSVSEDRTIRVWDISKRVLVHTYRRENDRFWIIAGLPDSGVVAVGHDSGMVVFKLARERPAADLVNPGLLAFVKDRSICLASLDAAAAATGPHVKMLAGCKRAVDALSPLPYTIQANRLNPLEVNLLVTYAFDPAGPLDDPNWFLITAPFESAAAVTRSTADQASSVSGRAVAVSFVGRKRFAILDPAGALSISSFALEVAKRYAKIPGIPEDVVPDRLYFAGNQRVFVRAEETLYLFCMHAGTVIADLNCPAGARAVVWNDDLSLVAVICKHHILFAGPELQPRGFVHEHIRVKSGTWDAAGVFLYTTLSHLKYAIPDTDETPGILRSVEAQKYLVKKDPNSSVLWYLTKDVGGTVQRCHIDSTEYMFKLALQRGDFERAAVLVRQNKMCGNSIAGYLRQKSFNDVALQFITDPETRFSLAIEEGLLDEAAEAAQLFDASDEQWDRLAVEASRQGRFDVAEQIYQNTKNFEKLSFLYFVSGNLHKMEKMAVIANAESNNSAACFLAMLSGDKSALACVLAGASLGPLATLSTGVYRNEVAPDLYPTLVEAYGEPADLDRFVSGPVPVHAPVPLDGPGPDEASAPLRNWERSGSVPPPPNFGTAMHATARLTTDAARLKAIAPMSTAPAPQRPVAPDADEDLLGVEGSDSMKAAVDAGGWGDFDQIGDGDVEAELVPSAEPGPAGWDDFEPADVAPEVAAKPPLEAAWAHSSDIQHLLLAGRISEALDLARSRVGLIDPEPLKPLFRRVIAAGFCELILLPELPNKELPVLAEPSFYSSGPASPRRLITLESSLESLRGAHRVLLSGKIDKALEAYRRVLHQFLLLQVATRTEEQQALEMFDVARTYAVAMAIEVERQKLPAEEVARSVELAAYLGSMPVRAAHQFLTFRRALSVAWKAHFYITAAAFARQLIRGTWTNVQGSAEAVAQARKILAACEAKASDPVPLAFDASDIGSLTVCPATFTPVRKGDVTVKCGFCKSVCKEEATGKTCPICCISQIGARTIGFQLLAL